MMNKENNKTDEIVEVPVELSENIIVIARAIIATEKKYHEAI